MTENKIEGYWWLPSEPKKKRAGTLYYSHSNNIELNLIGNLNINVKDNIDLIHGFSKKGKKITLYNNYCSKHSVSHPGIETHSFTSNFMFFGELFESIKDLKFKRITFDFHNSNKWLMFREGLNHNHDHESDKIKITVGPALNYNKSFVDYSVSLQISFNVNTQYGIAKSTVIQRAYYCIEKKRRVKFEDLMELYLTFKNLIVFCNQVPIIPREIILITKRDGLKDSKKVILFYSEKFDKKAYLNEEERLPTALIEGETFQLNYEQIIENWFKKSDKLNFLTNVYFNNFYNSTFLSDKFLTNARLLEGLHREFINSGSVYQVNRYLFILKKYKKLIKSELQIRSNILWAKKLKDYRNKLSHNNRILKSKALLLKDLEQITYGINLLVTCVLLEEIGFENNELGRMVERTSFRLKK